MIDLSFLTEAEQEAILKVLNRDSVLKKAEEQRVRQLQDKVNDENELKYKSGQWFYEAKSRRHRDKIHGADLVRASIRKRKKPATIAELSQSSKNRSQRSWVNSINQDIFIPPEQYAVMEPPDETEEDLMSTKAESNNSAKRVSFSSPDTDKGLLPNGTASPAKQRKNPFNSENSVDATDLDTEMSNQSPQDDQVNGQGRKKNIMSSIIKYGVRLPYAEPISDRQTAQEAEEDSSTKQPPVPKPRKLVINGGPPERSNSSLQREDSLNGTNKRRGILKRRSSSSSTDSESIRIPLNGEPMKLVLPASPILEAEQPNLFDDQVSSSENSPDRQKQVRFSEKVLQKPPTPNLESYNMHEIGEYGIFDPSQNELDYEMVDYPHYEDFKPNRYSYNSTEAVDQSTLEETPTVQISLNSAPILDDEKKMEDRRREIKDDGVYDILDERRPEINIDSAGTEPVYTEVRKPPKSTSSDQEKDFAMEDALMEPRLLDQKGKTERAYQTEKTLEFGKSYGGGGKINYGSHYTIKQPEKVSTNEDILSPEKASNKRSSYNDYEDEPKPTIHDSDYFPKLRRPYTSENEDLLSDRFVKPYPENRTNSKYSSGEHKTDTKYKSMFLKNTPEVEGRIAAPSSNFPVAQTLPSSPRPLSGDYQTHEITLCDSPERRDLPKSANFKVMSLKDRIHDMPSTQMSNPSQFQSLKHFWNAEDKNWSKGDVVTSPEKILTDISKRNKPIRADFKQRNSKEIPISNISLSSSFDSLSEEEQTSQKVASWLAQTPAVYGAEQLDADEDQVQPGEEVMENIDKTSINRKNQAEEFSSALQKLTDEALETPKVTEPEYVKSKDKQISPFKESDLLDQKKNTTTFSVSSAEKRLPPTKFYERVVQISNAQSPAEETNTTSKQYPEEEIEESVERSVAPAKTANEFKIGFQKLMEEYESVPTKSDPEHQEEVPNAKGKEQQLIEMEEIIDKSFVPKGNDHQEFIAALNRLKIEASTPYIAEDQDEQPEPILMQNSESPVKSSLKIGFEHLMPAKEDTYEPPQKSSVNYTVQSSPHYNEDTNGIEEVVEKTSAPSRVDENDLSAALKKLEEEAAVVDPSEPEDNYEKPKITPTLQSARSFEIPRSDKQILALPSDSMEKTSAFEDPLYSNRSRKSSVEAKVTNAIPEKEETNYSFYGQGKLPVEEETIEKTIIDTEESNADYKNRLIRLEEEAASSVPEEPEDLSVGDTFHVSPAPTKEVFISKKVFNNESMPVELPSSRSMPKDLSQPEPYAYKELANYPQSPSDQSGSFTGSAANVLYKKPGSSEVSNSKQGKPALAGSPSDSSSSKDKYTIEVMKAQDESISKVLDWFSRSSNSVDDQMPSVGLLEESTSPQKLITNADKLEDKASGHDVDDLVHGSEATQQMNPLPQMARNSESKEEMKAMDGDQPKIMNMIALSPVEDEFVPPQQMPIKESLEFGKSGSGSGKILHTSINEDSLQKYPQYPVAGEFEKGKDGLTESLEFGKSGSGCGKIQSSSINDNHLQEYPPLAVEGVSEMDKDGLTELMEFGKSGSGCGKIQSSSVNDSIQKHPLSPVGGVFEKDNLEAEKEESSVLTEEMSSLEEDDTGKTPAGKVKDLKEILTPILEDQSSKNLEKDISIIPQRRVSDLKLLWEGDSSSQDATKKPVLTNVENPLSPVKLSITPKSGSFDSDSHQEYPQLPVGGVSETEKDRLTELLEFGKSGSGCGKIQSSSSVIEDSLQKYPQLSMGGVFERDKTNLESEEGSELKHKVASLDENNTGETRVGKVKEETKFLIPILEPSENKSLKNTGEDIAISPQMRVSDIEPQREGDSPSQDVTISNVKHPFSPVELSTTPKSGSFDSVSFEKDPQPPAGEVSETEKESLTEFLEFGKSRSGGGKLQSRSINHDSPQKYPQNSVKDTEGLKAEKEDGSVLNEKMASLDEDDVRGTPMDKVKDQTKVLTPTLEQKEDKSSKKTEKDISIIPQRRVSDIKLLWEGDRPSQDATKKPVLSDIKHPFSPVESAITPKSDSFDSDDQNGASLVTFKKVIVEDEDDPISPINKLKSFWENDKNKDTTKGKPDRQSIEDENWTEHKEAPMADSKFKKRHTIQTFFETEKSTDPEKNLPGRSISLGESANESLKNRMKSTAFQSLKKFWNTSSKSDNKWNNQTLPENNTKQFGSNPDLRIKEPFLLKAKSRLAAKSLHDIRQDPSAVSHFQAYNAEPTSRKFSRGNSKKEDQQKSVNKTEINPSGGNAKPEKPIRPVDIVLQKSLIPSNYEKSSSTVKHEAEEGSGVSDEKQRALTKVWENSVEPKKIAESETSLELKTLQDEVLDKNINSPDEKPPSTTFENCPDDQSVYRDEENGEMNEKGRKMLLVKQNGFDVGSPVLSNVAEPLQEKQKELSENEYSTGKDEVSDLKEVVNENIEKTVILPRNDPSDFDRKLQNLYNESLNTDFKNGNLTADKYIGIDEPAQTFSKVLAVSSRNIQSSAPYKDNQPMIINISSKKTEIGNEDITRPQQDNLAGTSSIRHVHSDVPTTLGQKVDLPSSDVTNITSEELASELKGSLSTEPEVNEISTEPNNKDNAPQPEKLFKKIMERIEMPVVLPKTHSTYFDEKLKQLYEESQHSQPNLEETADSVAENNEHVGVKREANVYLYSSEPKKTFLKSSTVNLESSQSISTDRETLTDKSASSGSQAPDILLQEVNETIEKTVAPKRIANAKSLEELQKEALNEETGELVGNVSSGHVILNESISKLNDQALGENSISETIPREKEDPALEATEPARNEKHEEGTAETSLTFMSDRQSTPVKDKNSSLRRSTLELYLEAPYRREISKSIDFDTFGNIPSDADKYQTKLNSQKADTLGPTENSFPENAEKFKRMSQSVPAFLQDDTDGRETDSASESSFQIGRHKKSPSSLTNLSGSSGMASMSSVSGSVMSVYSGDFGNVDIKGNIEFALEYVQELKEFHIFVYQCKDLAAADVKKQRSDPYVKAYLLPEKAKMGKRKSAVKKKTLNPVYNEILRYKIPKESLETQTLNVSVWHHDALGRNSFLGEVNVNLATWDWQNTQKNWYPLEARTPASGIGLLNRGEIRLSLQYIPVVSAEVKKPSTTGEVQIWIKECIQLPMLRENKINSFVKCTILPDTSRKSRQKTRTVDKTPNPIFNHKMIYDGFKEDDLREACVELTVWDHNKLSNHFLGGIRIGFGTGKSYGTAVDWMDSSPEESTMWEKMITSPNTWIDGILPLRMFKMAKLAK